MIEFTLKITDDPANQGLRIATSSNMTGKTIYTVPVYELMAFAVIAKYLSEMPGNPGAQVTQSLREIADTAAKVAKQRQPEWNEKWPGMN